MKKNRLFIGLAALLLLGQTACEDNKEEYLDNFGTVLCFRNSGEIPLTVYKTGENTDYQLIVNKSGSNLGAATHVTVAMMDDASLAVYNAERGTDYQKLPANCFQFETASLIFDGSDLAKTVKVSLIPAEIEKLAAPVGMYVIPFEMRDASDSINAKRGVAFINPKVVTPEIYFDKTGYQMNTISDKGAEQTTLGLPLVLPLKNKWTFDCVVGIDETLLTAYNKENGVDYALLPEKAYTMNEKGIVSFIPGAATSNLNVNVKRSSLNYGNYVLPLRLNSCTHPTFLIDQAKNICLFGVSYVPDESSLKKVALIESMITYYPLILNEGSVANMIDGKEDTYYHSQYSPAVSLPHWIKVELSKESNAFLFEYQTRHSTNNGVPQQITIYGSMDDKTYSKIITITENLPAQKKENYKSPVLVGKSFKYLRFDVEKTPNGGSFALSEFRLFTN